MQVAPPISAPLYSSANAVNHFKRVDGGAKYEKAVPPLREDGGLHYVSEFGDRVDISKAALEVCALQTDVIFDDSALKPKLWDFPPLHLRNDGLMWKAGGWMSRFGLKSGPGTYREYLFEGQTDIGGKIQNLLKKNKIKLVGKEALSVTVNMAGEIQICGVGNEKANKIQEIFNADKSLARDIRRYAFYGESVLNINKEPSAQAKRVMIDDFLQRNAGISLDELSLDAMSQAEIDRLSNLCEGWAYHALEAQKTAVDPSASFTFNYRNGVFLDNRLAQYEGIQSVKMGLEGAPDEMEIMDPIAVATAIKSQPSLRRNSDHELARQFTLQLQYAYGGDNYGKSGKYSQSMLTPFEVTVGDNGALKINAGPGAHAGVVEAKNLLELFAPMADNYAPEFKTLKLYKQEKSYDLFDNDNEIKDIRKLAKTGVYTSNQSGKTGEARGTKEEIKERSSRVSIMASSTLLGVMGNKESVLSNLEAGLFDLNAKLNVMLEENSIFLDDGDELNISVNAAGGIEVTGLEDSRKARKIAALIANDDTFAREFQIQAFSGEWQANGGVSGLQGKRVLMDEFLKNQTGMPLDEFDINRLSDGQIEYLEKLRPGWQDEMGTLRSITPDASKSLSFSYKNGVLVDERVDAIKENGILAGKLRDDRQTTKESIEEAMLKEELLEADALEELDEAAKANEQADKDSENSIDEGDGENRNAKVA